MKSRDKALRLWVMGSFALAVVWPALWIAGFIPLGIFVLPVALALGLTAIGLVAWRVSKMERRSAR